MIDLQQHDKVIAKLQYFADNMHQRKLEKEALSIAIEDKELKSEIRSEILIYEEIIQEYYATFKDIICR